MHLISQHFFNPIWIPCYHISQLYSFAIIFQYHRLPQNVNQASGYCAIVMRCCYRSSNVSGYSHEACDLFVRDHDDHGRKRRHIPRKNLNIPVKFAD
jgi:hypothetical protein